LPGPAFGLLPRGRDLREATAGNTREQRLAFLPHPHEELRVDTALLQSA
jgi:hypothetical protein